MELPRSWLPPAALAAAQVAWWPLDALRSGGAAPGPVAVGTGLLAVCLAAAVLGLRRQAPVGALAGVTAVAVLGPTASFPGALDVFGAAGVALALHAVAVRCEAATVVIAGAAHLCWQLLWGTVLYGGSRGAASRPRPRRPAARGRHRHRSGQAPPGWPPGTPPPHGWPGPRRSGAGPPTRSATGWPANSTTSAPTT
ncbi:hypothetical protein LUW77_02235 [Streptomyces radiopugnans]|nr:hypothetical protein LUW77_02235 [Streptomyces radiopugnans]